MGDPSRTFPLPVPAGFDIASASHSGRVRSRNEDAWFNAPQLGLAIVADGVGGHGDGSWASTRAVALIGRYVQRAVRWARPATVGAREIVLARAVQYTHDQLSRANLGRAYKAASGTTIVGVWAPNGPGGMATAFNVGDSRLFRVSRVGIEQLSKDHSLHQIWIDGGQVGTEPSKRVIVQAVGISNPLTPHIISFPVIPGDSVLACTDGLTGTVTPPRMAELLAKAGSASGAADALVAEALAGPAPDNITVAVYRF